jgi:endonuclease/exonuclease/phosphatase family metal-dependent hydrolase
MKHLRSLTLAPWHYGALFFACLFLGTSCQKKQTPSAAQVLPLATEVAPAVVSSISETKPVTPVAQPATTPPATTGAAALRFVGYNVENWLILEERYDYETRVSSKNAPKPEKEKAAVISILTDAKPDVLGVCEIGSKEDLMEIQKLLKTAGLDLPHSHFSSGVDSSRHLGLLSRFPIASTATPADTQYKLDGKEYGIQRGVLDATVQTPDSRLWRFLGVHLKSKREVEDNDQNLMRINEAQLVRKHIDEILKADPQARIIGYGDFNDTRASSPIRIIQGPNNSPRAMSPIGLRDSRKQYWTHFWAKEDVYARLDYIFFSQALKKDVMFEECKILDPENWNDASDHRAVLGVFR